MSTAHNAVVKKAPVKYKREIKGISMYHDMTSGATPCCCPIAPFAPKSIVMGCYSYLVPCRCYA
eukprot:CAMPEP_0168231716 /NCGR_PEP_ID=MMETSP0140_2-20121125/16747_1 /TAXON_ID=44445 /ORGANISM="Pseudo-nitzschia australis, Strain 10249 10 AB" /LENGTH=63 /DNA_ID=CAMNT_0008164193 /DNA_START=1750 /DNA_END=1938 /DNA_ORIENTATION=-